VRLTVARLRAEVVARAFPEPAALGAVVARLGFVQMDPIRAPARAQDLILRHRAPGYRAGDLERHYPGLDVDEDLVYAYGVVPSAVRRLLHPRAGAAADAAADPLARRVLDYVFEYARDAAPGAAPAPGAAVHPRDVAAHFGAGAERNAWGGRSHATTRALERLHHHGLLRVARRERGVRLYAPAPPAAAPLPADERARELVLLLARLFAPLPEAALRRLMGYLRHALPADEGRRTVAALLRAGALERGDADGVAYVWPAGALAADAAADAADAAPAVRFLAPFDPVVWDRARFAHLWGWEYRFEAYTPAARRARGYYALPLLWRDRVVGWANVAARGGALDVALGFVAGRPRERGFARAVDAEVAALAAFLAPPPG
jgi:hypothetical protein